MSDLESTDWSEVAANNIQPAPAGWPSNSSPTIVYATDREMMGAIKRDWNRRNPTIASGGAANVQTLTYGVAPAGYVKGQSYCFIAGFTNTGPATLNVNGLGAKAVQLNGAALVGNEFLAGSIVEVCYDGVQFQIVGGSGYLVNGGTISGTLIVSGQGIIKGDITGSNAAAGYVGEYLSSVVLSPGVTLTTGTPANATSLSLTAGDWDVSGELWVSVGTGGATLMIAGITPSSATAPSSPGVGVSSLRMTTAFTASSVETLPISPARLSVSTTTTMYLTAYVAFPSGTTTAYGRLGARRVR